MAEVEKKNLPGSSKIPKPKSKKVPADLGGRCIVLGLSNREWNIKKKKKKRTFNEKGEDLSSKIPKPKSKKVSADLGGRCIVLGLSNREWNIKKKKKKKRTLNEKWEDSSVKKKKKSLNEKGEDSSVKKKKKSLNEKGEEGSDDLPQDVSDDLPEDVEEGSDDLPQDVSDDLPEDVKEGSDDLPQDVKEGSDDLPEDVMEGAVMNHGDKPRRLVRTIKLNRKYLPEDVMEGAVMNHGDKPRRSVRTIKPNPKYLQENEQLSKYGDTKTARTIMLVELKKLIEANPLFRDKLAFPTLKSSRLRTLINQRGNEQLSKYGDTKIARTIMLVELKKLIKANPLFRDKLAFPTLKSSRLRTLINQRENEQLSKYGDTKIARTIMLVELKKLIKANPLFRDKLAFPTLKSSRLRTLINQRENEQLSKYGDTKIARTIMLVELKKLIKANPLFRDKLAFPTLKSSRLRTLINQRLEKESGFYFNMKFFEEKVLAGEWDEVEKYLAGFTKVDDNRYSMKIFFEIRKQKYLEALDR